VAYYDADTYAAWRYAAHSGVPRAYWRLHLGTHPVPAVAMAAREWLTVEQGPAGLLLHGPAGCGKTGLAVSILWAAWEQGVGGRFVLAPALLEACRAYAAEPHGPDPLDALRTTPLLVLDDVGAQRLTEFAEERLYVLVHARHANRRRTVVTTNLPPEALDDGLSARIAWRLRELCQPLAVKA